MKIIALESEEATHHRQAKSHRWEGRV